ncbi:MULTISPECIES: SDR family NAD(P)-dependent oxidoreductase [Citromicrobium]|uniref:SDR family NAD(P)-dependent oxidoreductase n=1 Tax=Citromicrobium TaxID=72173 RepID=UPI0001DD0574|nr:MULTISPECIES: SDR family NAD(P)-dependent oxidoreductase [Citromicrobium]ALG60483.1 short-chain dehydrogenase [Citromicrobium sp. JL477]
MTEKSGALAGRTVLITGASGGLGERFARLAAEAGAKVVLCARRVERLEQIAANIEAAGGQALAVALDVSQEASVKAGFDRAEAAFGTVDTVIANAGIEHSGSVFDISVEQFDQVFAVNVRGVFLTAREAARRMQEAGEAERGRIVLVSSITGQSVAPGILPYSASKAAVSHMGRLFAREWARTGPNVNCISPGYIATDINHDWFATERGQKHIRTFPRRRLLDEDGLDGAVLYLLSDAAKNTTGANFTIDDGQSL